MSVPRGMLRRCGEIPCRENQVYDRTRLRPVYASMTTREDAGVYATCPYAPCTIIPSQPG